MYRLERGLRALRPRPRIGFERELERALFPELAERRERSPQLLLTSMAVSAGLASVLICLGMLGLLPLGLQDAQRSPAAQQCRTVAVPAIRRPPTVVVARNGSVRVSGGRRVPARRVRRCEPATPR